MPINCYNTGLVYDNNNHRGYIGGIVGDRGFSYNCYNAGVVWYKGSSSGAYGISGRQVPVRWNIAIVDIPPTQIKTMVPL